jgi:hypothetical protein
MTATLVHSHKTPTGECHLGLLVKRAYRIEPGRRATPLEGRPAIYEEPTYRGDNEEEDSSLVHDADVFCFQKPLTDVLVMGSAHSVKKPALSLEASVRVERAQKTVRVTGDRRIEGGPGRGLSASSPEPFTSMPLAWERAYGGRDRYAEEKRSRGARAKRGLGRSEEDEDLLGSLAYPRNPVGRGFWLDVDRERVIGEALPNLDDPADPVAVDRLFARDELDWIDRPVAAGFGPIDLVVFPRCMFFLLRPDWSPPERPIRELAVGALLPQDLPDRDVLAPPDPRLYCCAPAGLAVCRLRGGERVSLQNLHPKLERLEFDLPGEAPRLLIEPPGAGARELSATLQAVLIEPDEDRVTLTWTGVLPVAGPYPPEVCREMRSAAVFER